MTETTEDEDLIHAEELLRTAELIFEDGGNHELRMFDDGPKLSGVYATAGDLVQAAWDLDGVRSLYLTPNPTRLEPHDLSTGKATTDADITSINWFLVDVDPPPDVDSKDGDRDVTLALKKVAAFLADNGWADSIIATSGRGAWLLYRIEQENTRENARLRSDILMVLHEVSACVDVSVYNASRVARLFGSMNLKPGAVRSGLVRVPDPLQVTSQAKLERVAAFRGMEKRALGDQGIDLVLTALEKKLGITPTSEKRNGPDNGVIHQLSDCPFFPNEDHTTAAILIGFDDGGVAFSCQGGRCKVRTALNGPSAMRDLQDLLGLQRIVKKTGTGKLKWTVMADIAPVDVETIWGGRLVLGHVNLVLGDEKIGKGLLEARVIADLTNGAGQVAPPRKYRVMVSSTEDQAGKTLSPRFRAAGADLNMILSLDTEGAALLPDGMDDLEEVIHDWGADFLWLDPIKSFFSARYNIDHAQDVNYILNLLAGLAERTGVTVVGNLHTNRKLGASARDKSAHSLEFIRVARSSVLIAHAKGEEPDAREIIHVGHNYTARAEGLQAWKITRPVLMPDGQEKEYPVLELNGPSPHDEVGIFMNEDPAVAFRDARADESRAGQCVDAIKEHWSRLNKPRTIPATIMTESLEADGFTRGTRDRAKKKLGIGSRYVTDSRPPLWLWSFPDDWYETA